MTANRRFWPKAADRSRYFMLDESMFRQDKKSSLYEQSD